jgi:hypothetical protein
MVNHNNNNNNNNNYNYFFYFQFNPFILNRFEIEFDILFQLILYKALVILKISLNIELILNLTQNNI